MFESKRIVIVGGGTSGWLAAAYLVNQGHSITLVDKEESEPVGVGEATLLNFGQFMEDCGFDFYDWFTNCRASYKQGILFKNWDTHRDVWHPFSLNTFIPNTDFTKYDLWSNCQHLNFREHAINGYNLCVKHNCVMDNLTTAYHIDCSLLVRYVKNSLLRYDENKFMFIPHEVDKVNVNSETGNCENIFLKNGVTVAGDLFIDCTGWTRLLSSGREIQDLSNILICDSAIAGQIENVMGVPYTICEPMEDGWMWKISVQSTDPSSIGRLGTGLVFNRSITDIEDAKQKLSDYWNGPRYRGLLPGSMRLLKWRPERVIKPWDGNVIQVGLSSGFIEPIESTSISILIDSILCIADCLDIKNSGSVYNKRMEWIWKDAVSFVNLHYTALQAHKNSEFWNEAKKLEEVPEIQYYKDFMRSEKRFSLVHNTNVIFNENNWVCWLTQLGYPVSKRKLLMNEKDIEEVLHIENYLSKANNPLFGFDLEKYIKFNRLAHTRLTKSYESDYTQG